MGSATDSVLWRPSEERVESARLTAFARAEGRGPDYAGLHAWSVREPEVFWSAVWERCGVVGERGDRVLVDGGRMPGARFFPEARLSFAENLLRGPDAQEALVYVCEGVRRRALTWAQLREAVARLRAGLRSVGVRPGDRVAALLPNVPEAVVGMLATSSLGAAWSSCSPDFGTSGVLDRFVQIEPRVLLWGDAHVYKGVEHAQLPRLAEVLAGLPTVERTVVVPTGLERHAPPDLPDLPGVVGWEELLSSGRDDSPFERFPFEQPLYVLFSSGTTGKPKCIVHGQGGTLLQHLKEHQLHTDLRPGERLMYFTTTGWMMWNWQVTALASGATVVLYDGNPFHPGPQVLWQLCERERLNVFGTSAKFLDACKGASIEPGRSHDLSKLRALLSTGSPLVPESFDWVYASVKRDLQLSSITGGTDIVSCFALGCPILPVRRGEIQCLGLGMKVEVWDPRGRPLVGEPGELVCTLPFPSMPLGFWGDQDGARFRAAYFEHFPGVWRHGDWATLTDHGSLVVTGRSDATLNPGGVRIGTAEIYRQVEQLEEVIESLAVGQDWRGDQRVVLFVVLRQGLELDDALRDRIRRRIRQGASPRHVPAVIARVTDLPRTRSGKLSELAARDVVHGRPVANTEALANPEALDELRNRPELA